MREFIFYYVYRNDTRYVLQDELKNCFPSQYNIEQLVEKKTEYKENSWTFYRYIVYDD